MLVSILSTIWAESCMIELLGDVFKQNEPTLTILVLLGLVGDASWHSEHILDCIMHDVLASKQRDGGGRDVHMVLAQ